MFVVGITGGIGSGKTAVTDHLETLGIVVVDADKHIDQVCDFNAFWVLFAEVFNAFV